MASIRNVISLAIIAEVIGDVISVSITYRDELTANNDKHSILQSTDDLIATQDVLGPVHETTLARELQVVTGSSALELTAGNPKTPAFKSAEKTTSSTPSLTDSRTTAPSPTTSLTSSQGTAYQHTAYHIEEAHNRVFHAVLGICLCMIFILLMVFVGGLIYARQHGWHGAKREAIKREESIFLNPPRRVVY